ncbi:hypothetical protein CYMTET_37959 [Cymbomonas tetramitiformis]|uniref:EF-hand domain-containing protein n=1 Tax=Cymbomonas tetramitiformis TaxID=36881 RepID=A0AAE0CF80_9CHLO|nr:hypothetical protein CYMTET_37959 [Cymbomonas tetramitiformis]
MSRHPRISAPALEIPRHTSPPPRVRRHSSTVSTPVSRRQGKVQPAPPNSALPPLAGAMRNLRRSQYAANIDTRGLINAKVLVKTKKQTIPLKDLRHLKQFFDQLDRNGDETVSLEEVEEHIREQYTVGCSKGDQAKTIVTSLQEHLRGGVGRPLTFKGLLKLSYPTVDNEDIDKCVLAIVPPQAPPSTLPQQQPPIRIP